MLNRTMTNTEFDSGSLSAMATIARRMSMPGVFIVEAVDERGRVVRRSEVVVREGEGAAAGASINLVAEEDSMRCQPECPIAIATGGMLSFHAIGARRGMSVRMIGASEKGSAWNSQALEPGDLYACMPLRPGRYAVHKEEGGVPHMHLRVSYPDPRELAQGRKLRTGTVLMRNDVEIDPGQAVLFAIERPARVRVRLEEANDGPSDLAEWRAARNRQALDDALKRWTRKAGSSAE